MNYIYYCEKCKKNITVIKPKEDENKKEFCLCGWELVKK